MSESDEVFVESEIETEPSDLPTASLPILLSLPEVGEEAEYDPEKQVVRVPPDLPKDGKSVRYVSDSLVEKLGLPTGDD